MTSYVCTSHPLASTLLSSCCQTDSAASSMSGVTLPIAMVVAWRTKRFPVVGRVVSIGNRKVHFLRPAKAFAALMCLHWPVFIDPSSSWSVRALFFCGYDYRPVPYSPENCKLLLAKTSANLELRSWGGLLTRCNGQNRCPYI